MPADILDPYLVPFREHPDYSHADAKAEAIQIADLNDMAIAVLEGRENGDCFLDALDHYGYDPLAWMADATHQMNRIVDGGVYVMNETGLYLPL
jgi:hypothetical protein